MYRILIVLAIVCSLTNGLNITLLEDEDRIVGGGEVDIEKYPYQLSLQYYGRHICGASIISEDWAITAAHCLEEVSSETQITLRAGSSFHNHGGYIRHVSKIVVHNNFNKQTIDYDFALIMVSEAFPLDDSCVDSIELANVEPVENTVCTVSGWGSLSSGGSLPAKLRSVDVKIMNRNICSLRYLTYTFSERMFCAGEVLGGKDSCQGDSGGPIVCKGVLAGIVSWGVGCASPLTPGVYSNIPVMLGFIKGVSGLYNNTSE